MVKNLLTILRCCLITVCGVALATSPVSAAPPGKGKPDKHAGKGNKGPKDKGPKHGDVVVVGDLVTAGITAATARALVGELGLDKSAYQTLPPGIRKNLARGKPLPPGIAKKMAPTALVKKLPVHAGHEWRTVGRDLVLVAIASGVIADVLSDVF